VNRAVLSYGCYACVHVDLCVCERRKWGDWEVRED